MRSHSLPPKLIDRLQERHTDLHKAAVRRTTFSAPVATLKELRHLALARDCLMNDLITIAVADLLESMGRPSHLAVDPALRARIKRKE